MAKTIKTYNLSGKIADREGRPLTGLTVHLLDQNPLSHEKILGKPSLTDSEGKYVITFTEKEFRWGLEQTGPNIFIRVFEGSRLLAESDVHGNAKEKTEIDLQVDYKSENNTLYKVSGKVLSTSGAPLEKYNLEALVITIEKEIPVGSATSNAKGEYSVLYRNPLQEAPDIQVKAFRKEDKDNPSRSVIIYNASTDEFLDVIVSAAAKEREASEFNAVASDLQKHLGKLKLSDLKENKENSHISYLSNKTGWDGRITAMLASAHQLGENLKIDPSHMYALLRAGVPADADSIKSLSLENVKKAIGNSIQKNIITDNGKIDETIHQLEKLSVDYLLRSKHLGTVSTMDEMLGIHLNADQKNIFAQTQKQVGNDGSKLWTALTQKGFSPETISQLQLDGKLGYLTGRNAKLVKNVYEKFNVKNDVDLVSSGLYKTSSWKEIIGSEIPEGLTADEYANHMAFQVKMSYPTAVAAEMIKRDEVNLGENVPKDEITGFFYKNESKFNLGVHPVKTWDNFKNLSNEAKASAKVMERIYQISPSDESMASLSKAGVFSAYQVVKYTKPEFIAKYGDAFPSKTEAELTYNKANEVYSASLGIATTYITGQTLPNVYSITGKVRKEQNATIAYPTLEELLGNMDYCACDHCKSVLSPAAYLVDLLQFIDLEDIPHSKANPIDTLKARRPDIQHIQLSCENTNMALPYIDLVNEILEYYLVYGNLTDLQGHDVAEGTSQADLLAEPQFVNKTAYDELKKKVFPYNLPFHQPLETLRRLFQIWDFTLEDMLATFSTSLLSRKETLGFNEDEYKTITDVAFKKLPEYFGEPENNTIDQLNSAIANGKIFSRRVDISYEDLVTLLKTRFINPGSVLVPLFQKLKLNLVDLNNFYTGVINDAQLDALLPTGIDPAGYGGDIKQWLRDNQQLIMGLITLTDIGPEAAECDFAKVELRFALPDNSNNKLTTIAYHKFHRFLRLLIKTGWSISTLDAVISTLLPIPSEQITDANIDATFVTLLNRMANFSKLAKLLSYSEKKFPVLLLILDSSKDTLLRSEQCAKITKLSKSEFTELGAITGIDPLASDMEADNPSLVKFVKISQLLKAVSIKVVDLAYLLHHNDISGKLTPSDASLMKNIKILRDTINTIEKENSIAPDNADFNFAKNKMLLVYDIDTTNDFFDFLLQAKVFSASLNTSEEALPVKLTNADARVGFDPFKKEITYTGVMTTGAKTALDNAANSLVLADMETITAQPDLDAYIANFKAAIGQIFTDSNAALTSFGTRFPELRTIYDAVVVETTPAAQTKKLVDLLLPELKSKLKINGLQQALIGILKSDPDTVTVLTSRKEVLKSAANIAEPVLFDFLQLEDKLVFDQNLTYNLYIDVPATDNYLLYVAAPQNTVITLKIGVNTVINNVTVGADNEVSNSSPVAMKTGELHLAELTIGSLPASKSATLLWRTKGIGKTTIPGSNLYKKEKTDFAKTSLIRLSKAAQLQTILGLTPQELDYFAAQNSETSDFLNDIDTNGSISAPDLVSLWQIIKLLINFKQFKTENEPEENTWLQVLKDPNVKNTQNKLLLEYFNMWKEQDVTDVLAHFGASRSDLSKISILAKVKKSMEIVSSINYPATDILTWVTNDPSYDLVAGIKSTIKQKVTEAVWLETMQTVSDPVRNLLRDALISYILQYKKPSPEIIHPDKLYEYFLIDVEMDACMKTSRIRLALSTVQLFIQRCLMNLEPTVDPASIRAPQWAWMKRYRVWEANRKVFLYPENWLEPELRDNKSSIFKELEGELLQSDITDEAAELAFLNYLKKLDDIAKLEIIGMYLEENEKGNQDDDILHAFGRTMGNTRQYYYRRYEYGYWTPWEKISLNIEGEHFYPIVWRKRLFVFWLNILEKPSDVNGNKTPQTLGNEAWSIHQRKTVEVSMCWGEYYKGKWTSPKSSEFKKPMVIYNLYSFDSKLLLIYGRKDIIENPAGKFRERLIFNLRYRGGGLQNEAVFTFTSKNAPPYLAYGNDQTILDQLKVPLDTLFFNPYYGTSEPTALFFTQFNMPGKTLKVNVKQPAGASKSEITETVLSKGSKLTPGFSILPIRHTVENQLESPLSYADEHSTLFVSPDERVFTPIRFVDVYFPIYETPIKYQDIPLLVDKPIIGWPPEEKINIGEDIILENPWEWNNDAIRRNTNFNKVLPTKDIVKFGDALFDTGGKIIGSTNTTF